GAGRGDVVDAVVDDVDSDAAVAAGRDRDLDLGPDAVGAGGELAAAGERVQAGERTDSGRDLLAVGGGKEWPDTVKDALRGLDVDAGRRVRKTWRVHTFVN